MSPTHPAVLVAEPNATRADLYDLWLDEYDVRQAHTATQAVDAVDGSIGVAVVAETLDEKAEADIVDRIRAVSPYCQIVSTSADRRQICPTLAVDTHLTKPVFEDELRETVADLETQACYAKALVQYYRFTVELTSTEVSDDAVSDSDCEALEKRVTELRNRIREYSQRLAVEERQHVIHSVLEHRDMGDDGADSVSGSSKYVPDKCSRCGSQWGDSAGDSRGYRRLGSFVWRCTNCGRLQMNTDPSFQQTTPY